MPSVLSLSLSLFPCRLILDDKLTELTESFHESRTSYPCMTILSPHDNGSSFTQTVAPFMMKLIRDKASECLKQVESLISDGQWSPKELTVSTAWIDPELSVLTSMEMAGGENIDMCVMCLWV